MSHFSHISRGAFFFFRNVNWSGRGYSDTLWTHKLSYPPVLILMLGAAISIFVSPAPHKRVPTALSKHEGALHSGNTHALQHEQERWGDSSDQHTSVFSILILY